MAKAMVMKASEHQASLRNLKKARTLIGKSIRHEQRGVTQARGKGHVPSGRKG